MHQKYTEEIESNKAHKAQLLEQMVKRIFKRTTVQTQVEKNLSER